MDYVDRFWSYPVHMLYSFTMLRFCWLPFFLNPESLSAELILGIFVSD